MRVRLRDDAHPLNEVLRVGDLVLDVGRLEANIGNGPVALTRLEFLLLRELMEHAGQSVGKGQLLASVWGYDFDPGLERGGRLRAAAALQAWLRADQDGAW